MRKIGWSVGVVASVLVAVAWAAVRAQDSVGAQLQARLRNHAQFAKTQFALDDTSFPTLALLYNKPQSNVAPNFHKPLGELHAPWLLAQAEQFKREFAEPLGLRRRDERSQTAVIVLWTATDYAPYAKAAPDPNGFTASAHYDRDLGALVTFEYGGPVLAPHWKRFPELAQLVRSELDAYGARPDVRLPYWVSEGLSAYLASHQAGDINSLDKHAFDPRVVEHLVRTMHDRGLRNGTLLTLREMFAPKSLGEVKAALVAKVGPAVEKVVKPDDFAQLELGQAWTFVAYLHEGEGGKYAAPFATYLRSALAGDGALEAFQRAFPGVDIGALELAWYRWVFEQYAVLRPAVPADPRVLEGIGGPGAAKGAPVAGFDSRVLAFGDDELEAEHALVLQKIRSGQLEDALTTLAELRQRPKVGEYAARLDKELLRCRKFVVLRDKHVAALAAGGSKCTFEYQGKKVIAKVKSVADGKLFLEENKQKVDFIPITALDPYELARDFAKSVTDGPDGWARWYPYVLAGDTKAVRGIKGSPEALELRADAEQWYPAALKLGAGMALLVDLAGRSEPKDREAALACVATIKALNTDYGELAPVAKRKDALRTLATAAFELLFEPARIAEATVAKVELLPDGRVRLSYAFEKKGEAADFLADPSYYSIWRKNLGPLASKDGPTLEVARGTFRALGAGCWRHVFEFEGAITLKYDVGFEFLAPEKRSPLFMFAVLDDKADSFVSCQGFGSLDARDFPSKFRKTELITEGRQISEGLVYQLEFEVSNGKATSREAGKVVKQVDSGPRTRGGVFFYVHTETPVVLSKLVIEGRPDMAGVKARWSALKLAELKL